MKTDITYTIFPIYTDSVGVRDQETVFSSTSSPQEILELLGAPPEPLNPVFFEQETATLSYAFKLNQTNPDIHWINIQDFLADQTFAVHHQALQAGLKQIELMEAATQAKIREQRALADYQNLLRRNREERTALLQSAARDFVEALLPSLEHLELANKQLADKGMAMIIDQLWRALADQGLEKIDCLGKPFDVSCMEAVDQTDEGTTVTSVVRSGFKLNGHVIQHAKVILGTQD